MKKFGSICDYKEQRLSDLRKAVTAVLRESEEELTEMQVFEQAVKRPAPRFYISEERAVEVVGKRLRGIPDEGLPSRRAMHDEIFRRFLKLKELYSEMKIITICAHIIHSPAPEFYLTPRTAREFLGRHNREVRRKRREKNAETNLV